MSLDPLHLEHAPRSVRIRRGGADTLLDEHVERLRARTFEAGRAQGREESLQGPAGALTRAAEALTRARGEAEDNLARIAVELALEIAESLVHRSLAAGDADLESIVRETLRLSEVDREGCTLHLNPDDLDQLPTSKLPANLSVEADASLGRGDLQLATPHGLLVRDVEASLADIRERLLEGGDR